MVLSVARRDLQIVLGKKYEMSLNWRWSECIDTFFINYFAKIILVNVYYHYISIILDVVP